ncbi:hypothetical protein D9M71_442820 [compost metagenome]
MPGTRIDAQRREVAQVQLVAGQRLLVTGQRAVAVAVPGEQCRRPLFTEDDALLQRVPGHGFEGLVLVFRWAEVKLREVGDIQRTGIGIEGDDGQLVIALIDNRQAPAFEHGHPFRIAPAHQRHLAQHVAFKGQLDQKGILAHDREQGFAHRVVGQVGSFIILHAWQHFGVDIDLVVRQPDAGLLLNLAFETLLQPEQATVIPMHGNRHAVTDDRGGNQPGGPAQGQATLARRRQGITRRKRSGHGVVLFLPVDNTLPARSLSQVRKHYPHRL